MEQRDELISSLLGQGFTHDEMQQIEDSGIPLDLVPQILEPITMGPTWEKDAFGRWVLPERTLGWQIAGWTAEYLLAKEGGPWKFTLEQLRFLLWWYAVDELDRFVYRTGVLQRMKGWGKDPLLAVICLVELCGPSRPSRERDAKGNPVGVPHPNPHVQIVAVSQEQTANTMDLIPSLMSEKFRKEFRIKPGAELIRANGGRAKLKAVTSNPRSLEGNRTTFTLLNETHHWVQGNKGHRMYETIDGNATKGGNRFLAITNAYLPGEDSVAERMRIKYTDFLEGRAENTKQLYDTLEAHPKTPLSGPLTRRVLELVKGDAWWQSIDAILLSIVDKQIGPARSRRMWLNQVVAEDDAVHGPETWGPLKDLSLELLDGEEIVLGFDGGKTDDSTALVAIRCFDSAIFTIALWEKPQIIRGPEDEKWQVDRIAVDAEIHRVFASYRVKAFYADVALWESYVDAWATEFGDGLSVKASERHAVAWDMRTSLKRSTMAHERLVSAIFDRKLRHDGDRRLERHVLNAKRRVNNFGLSFGKESKESPRKVDLYAALMLAHEALSDYRLRGKTEKKRSTRGAFL